MQRTHAETLQGIFLDFWGNYLTAECFAETNGLTESEARRLIALTREIHDRRAEEYQREGFNE